MTKGFSRKGKQVLSIIIATLFLFQTIPFPGAFSAASIPEPSLASIIEAQPPGKEARVLDQHESEQVIELSSVPTGEDNGSQASEEMLVEEKEGTVHTQELPIRFATAEVEPLDAVNSQEARVKPGEIIVCYKEQKSTRFAAQANGRNVASVVYASPDVGLEETLAQLRQDPNVLYAEPNYEMYALTAPNDPRYGEQWGLQRIKAEGAWADAEYILDENSADAASVTIAILDTGVDSSHEDLSGQVLSGYNVLNGSTNAEDDSASSHGTLVAGIAAAFTNNQTGIAGAAGSYPVRVLPVKVLDSAGIGSMYDVAQGICWAVDNGAKIINLSLGARLPDYPVTLAEAIQYAQERGVLVVAAAGNEGKEVQGFYPACLPGVVSVMASDKNNYRASFSNYGGIVEVIAPGVDILSTARGNAYSKITGTSAAAPLVAGAAAMLWSALPDKTPAELSDALINAREQNGVFDAKLALYKLQYPQYYSYATMVEPADNSRVGGTVTLTAKVFNPNNAERVDFILETEDWSQEEQVLGTVQPIPDSGLCSLAWDTTTYPDGRYYVVARVDGSPAYGISLTVANQTAGGLSLSIKKPDGEPAAGAKVTVFHAIQDGGPGKYRLMEERDYQPAYQGAADQEGRVNLPATLAINGNEFLVVAQGTEPHFLYHRLLRSPGIYELDPTQDPLLAQPVTVTARKVEGDPLAGALLLAKLIDVELPEYSYLETSGIISEILITQLSASGTGQVWLTPGNYEFQCVSPEYAYFLRQNCTVGERPQDFFLLPKAEDVARVSLPEGDFLQIGIQLRDEQAGAFIGFDSIPGDRVLTVTPGRYTALIDTIRRDLNNYDWYLERLTPPFDLQKGEIHEISLGEGFKGELKKFYEDREYFTTDETAYFKLRFFDGSAGDTGNVITYLGYQAASLSGLGSATGSAKPAAVIKPASAGKALGTEADLEGSEGLAERKMLCFNPVSGAFEIAGRIGTQTNAYLEIEDEQGAVVAYRNFSNWWNHPWDTWDFGLLGSWYPYSPGIYHALAKLTAGPFAVGSPGGIISSDPLSFEVREPDTGEPSEEAGLRVKICYGGDELASDELVLLEKYGNSYVTVDTWADKVSPDEFAYQYFWPEESGEYAVAIRGYKDSEPFFAFVPFIGGEEPLVVEVDLTGGLHRLLLQLEEGAGGVPSKTSLGIYGRDSSGARGGVTFSTSYYGEVWPVWVPEGSYTVQLGKYATQIASDSSDGNLFHLTRDITVSEEDLEEIPVVLSLDQMVRLTPKVDETEAAVTQGDPSDYLVGGLLLYGQDGGSTPFFWLRQKDQTIYLPAGSYTATGLLIRKHYEGSWHYWLEGELNLTGDRDWLLDDAFTSKLSIDAGEYRGGETLESTHVIQDSKGNRLIAMYMPTGYGMFSNSAPPPVQPQNHGEVAPFLVIREAGGAEVFRAKEAQPNYDILLEWDQYSGVLRPFAPTTSFYQGSFQVPDQLPSGTYQAVLELGAGPEGLLASDPVDFSVRNDQASPRLNSLVPELTNQNTVNISGTAAPGAVVIVSYRLGTGEAVALDPVNADPVTGKFNLEFILPADGSYVFTARAMIGDMQSAESDPVTLVVDRTPPGAPTGFTGTVEDANHITLSWDSSPEPDVVAYRLTRDGTLLAEVPNDGSRVYQDSGLTANTTYNYALVAVDEAGNLSQASGLSIKSGAAGDSIPPAAPAQPQVLYRLGGMADIYWQPTTDNIGVAGYKIFRAMGDGEPEERGSVSADQVLEFQDQGLLAETRYVYTIRAFDGAGNESDPSPAYELTTPALSNSLVSYRFPLDGGRSDLGLVNPGTVITVKLVGEKGRQGSAEVTYILAPDENSATWPEARTVVTPVFLSERVDLPGTYQGTFTVPEGSVEISSITGILTDGAGHESLRQTAANLPLQVAGILRVEISFDDLEQLSGFPLMVESPTTGQSSIRYLDGAAGIYFFSGLKPAEDYSVSLRNNNYRLIINETGIAVPAGREAIIQGEPIKSASLRVQVLDHQGMPVEGAAVSFYNSYTGTSTATTDSAGYAESGSDSLAGEEVSAIVTLSGRSESVPCYNREEAKYTLAAGLNEKVIHLQPLPTGTITGITKLDTTGEPLRGVIVTAAQYLEGKRSLTTTAVSDEEGRYTLTVPTGLVTVSASTSTAKYVEDNVRSVWLSEGGLAELDLTLSAVGKAQVDVTIQTKYIDQEETVIRDMNWATAVHYRLKGTDAMGTISRDYPLQLRGAPGDVLSISVDGVEAFLPQQELKVTLDDKRQGEAIFRLEEQGRIIGRVLDENGRLLDLSDPLLSQYRLFQGRLYELNSSGQRSFVCYVPVNDGSFRITVPRLGRYLLDFYYDPMFSVNSGEHPTYTAVLGPITVNQYQITDLGDVELTYNEATNVRGSLFTSQAEAAPGGMVRLGAEIGLYETMNDWTLQNTVFKLALPAGCQLVEGSMVFDGREINVEMPATAGNPITADLGDVVLKKGQTKVLNCLVLLDDPQQASRLMFGGSLDWNAGAWHKELAATEVRISKLTLNAPAVLVTPETTVSGRGPAGATVRVYDETLLLGETIISPGGYWYLRVTLPDKGNPVRHRLHATSYWQDLDYCSDTLDILFDPDEPVLTEVIIKQGGGPELHFAPTDGVARFPYVVVPNAGGVELTLKFNQANRVKNAEVSVFPYSSPAVKQSNGDFKATVNFYGYQLGAVYLKYETKKDPTELKEMETPTEEQLRNRLSWQLQDLAYETIETEEEKEREGVRPPEDWPEEETPCSAGVKFTLPQLPDIDGRVEMTVARDVTYWPTAEEVQEANETGIPVYGFKMTGSQIIVPSNSYTIWVEGYIPQAYLDSAAAEAGMVSATGVGDLAHVGAKVVFTERNGKLFNAADWSMNLKDGLGVPGKLDELGRLVDQAAGCGRLSNMYKDRLDRLATKLMIGEGAKAGMMLGGTLLGPATFGVGTLLIFAASKAMEYAIDKQIEKDIAQVKQDMAKDDECKKDEQNNDNNDNDNNDEDSRDRKKKKIADPTWIWDPSGTVYEAVPENPLAGVRATIYEQVLGQDGTVSMMPWNSQWYGQENPLYTGSNGYYGWDVPPGEWQVVYEKDGYIRAQSEVMTVPPPRTNVDIGMKSLAVPAVQAVTAAGGGSHVDISFDRYMLAGTLNTGAISLVSIGGEESEFVRGQVYGVETVIDPQNSGILLTRKARFEPEEPLTVGNVYQVLVRGAVQSYAGIPMGNDYQVNVTVPGEIPPVGEVSNAQAVAGDQMITVSWSDPGAENLSQIKLYWKAVGAGEDLGTQSLDKGALTYTIRGLSNGTQYQVKITTIDEQGRESNGVVVKATPKAEGGSNPSSSGASTPLQAVNEIRVRLTYGQQTVEGFNRDVLLNIPDGAFGSQTSLSIRVLDANGQIAGSGMLFVSPVYEFNTGGVAPQRPLYLTLRFNQELLGSTDPRQMGIYRQDDRNPAQWVYMGGIVDLLNNSITVQLTGFSRYAVMASQPVFDDLSGHWSQKDVEILAARGVVGGVGGGYFQPDRPITRAELSKLLVKMIASDPLQGIKIEASPIAPFKDVGPDAWYRSVVETAARLGLVQGNEGLFRPDDLVTREEMAVMIIRTLNIQRQYPLGDAGPLPFKDGKQISSWAADEVTLAWQMGLMQGINQVDFQPKGRTTRAQATVVAFRVMERMGLLTAISVKKGNLIISELEGRHFALTNCTEKNTSYVLLPASAELERQMASLVEQEVQVTALPVPGMTQYMSGPVLRVLSISKDSQGGG